MKSKEFDELVAHYGEVDSQIKAMSKELDSEKAVIKERLEVMDLDSYTSGGYKVSRQVSYRTKIDEDKMLEVLKADWKQRYGDAECPYIKTKEFVDMDKLEAVIYANELPFNVLTELDKCQEKTEVIALKCSKVKEKK